MELEEASDRRPEIWLHWMAAHAEGSFRQKAGDLAPLDGCPC